jgi:hypothetical protein
MIAVYVLEFLGSVREGAAIEQPVRVGIHLARRVGIERLGRVVGAGTAAEQTGSEQTGEDDIRP